MKARAFFLCILCSNRKNTKLLHFDFTVLKYLKLICFFSRKIFIRFRLLKMVDGLITLALKKDGNEVEFNLLLSAEFLITKWGDFYN